MRPLFKSTLVGLGVILVLILGACSLGSASTNGNCQKGICVDIQLAEPIRFNQPVTATITVETDRDTPQLSIKLAADFSVSVEGTRAWEVDAKAHQLLTFTGMVRFTQVGHFDVVAGILTTLGEYVQDDVPVDITSAGGTVSPQLTPYSSTPEVVPTLTPTESRKFNVPTLMQGVLPTSAL